MSLLVCSHKRLSRKTSTNIRIHFCKAKKKRFCDNFFRKFPENFLDFPNSSWYFSEFSQNISRNFSWKLWNQFSFVAMLKNIFFFYLWNCLRKKCDILSIELSKERKYVKTFFIVKWITGKIKDWSDIKIILFLLLKLLSLFHRKKTCRLFFGFQKFAPWSFFLQIFLH